MGTIPLYEREVQVGNRVFKIREISDDHLWHLRYGYPFFAFAIGAILMAVPFIMSIERLKTCQP